MSDIDPSVIDVDFPKCPEYTRGDFTKKLPDRYGTFEDFVQTISRSDAQRLSEEMEANKSGLDRLVTRIYNQQQEGSCVANATGQALEILQAKQLGEDAVVHLSAMSLYKRIGRSPQSGSTLPDAWDEIQSRGMLPLDDEDNRRRFGDQVMPNTGWRESFPSNWQETAKLFRGTEGHVIRSVDGIVTSLILGYPVVVGRQGHSICYTSIAFRSGRMLAAYANSWGDWGQGFGDMPTGFGFDSESQIRMSGQWAFCIRSAVVPTR